MRRVVFSSAVVTIFAVGTLFASVVVAQQSSQVEQNLITVTITESSLQVTPSDASLTANTPFRVAVENQTGSAISLVLELPGGVNQPVVVSEGDASVSAAPGQILDQVWTVPTAGSYQIAVYKNDEPPAVSARSATLTIGGQQ